MKPLKTLTILTTLSAFIIVALSFSAMASGHGGKARRRVNPQCLYWMASSNLQNFLLTPGMTSNEFSRTPEEFNAKIQKVGGALATLANGTPRTTAHRTVLGLVNVIEASTQENLSRLIKETPLRDLGLNTQIMSTVPDGRGINPGTATVFEALSGPINHLYYAPKDATDKNTLRLWAHSGAIKGNGPPTRPILEVVLKLPNDEELHNFVNHWPSQLEGNAGVVRREQAALAVTARWNAILATSPHANIFSSHDSNTDVYGPEILAAMQVEMPPRDQREIDDSKMYVLNYDNGDYYDILDEFHAEFPKATADQVAAFTNQLQARFGTFFYGANKEWNALDMIFVSGHMLRYYVPGSFEIVKNGFIDNAGHPNSFNSDTKTGVTDHFPVRALFDFNQYKSYQYFDEPEKP